MRPELWAVAGGKGGVGKSILSLNLAVLLARSDARVTIVDGDLGAANQHDLLGVAPTRTLSMFLRGEVAALQTIALATEVPGLSLVPGAYDDPGAANPAFFCKRKLLRHLQRLDSELVVLDLGSGTSFNTLDLFNAADRGILVTMPEPTAIQNTYGFLKCAVARRRERAAKDKHTPEFGEGSLGVVVNRGEVLQAVSSFRALERVALAHLDLPLVLWGNVRAHEAVCDSVQRMTPFVDLAPSAKPTTDLRAVCEAVRSGRAVMLSKPPRRSAVPGRNEEVVWNGLLLHVQTEDLGPERHGIRTQVFCGGSSLFVRNVPYDVLAPADVVRRTLELQHRTVIRGVLAGKLRRAG